MKNLPHRVVISGVGAVSPFGTGATVLVESLSADLSGARFMQELADYPRRGPRTGAGLHCHPAPLPAFNDQDVTLRHSRRTRGAG